MRNIRLGMERLRCPQDIIDVDGYSANSSLVSRHKIPSSDLTSLNSNTNDKMPALQYGLNVLRNPTSLANQPPSAKRKTIFDDDSDPEDDPDEAAPEAITSVGSLVPSAPSPSSAKPPKLTKDDPATKPPSRKPGGPPQLSQYGDLSTNHTTALHASTAQSLDPSIYDYDSVYDSLHTIKSNSPASTAQGPKYMQNLLAAAEIRKRDQLRAKEKMLAKQREAEGDEFADKEKFVTGAYKAQQEEVRRMEEEEVRREREEVERRRRGGGGMVGLYKALLERDEKRHGEVVKAVEEGKGKGWEGAEDGQSVEKSEVDLAREKGAVVNDDGVVVDKRQLLNTGLNIAAKPQAAALSQSGDAARNATRAGASAGLQGRGGAKQAMRERQTRMLEAQLMEASKRAADDGEVQQEALERAAKSKKTEGDISSAKERYLQRKREAAAAAAAAKTD